MAEDLSGVQSVSDLKKPGSTEEGATSVSTCDNDDLLGGTACLARGPRESVSMRHCSRCDPLRVELEVKYMPTWSGSEVCTSCSFFVCSSFSQ